MGRSGEIGEERALVARPAGVGALGPGPGLGLERCGVTNLVAGCGAARRSGLVSVFRPPRKTSLSSSSHATADGSEDDEASEAVAMSETEEAAIAAPSVRPLKASKQKSSSATTFDRCGTFGCTLPDRHPGLHSFTMCEIRSRHLVQPPEPTPSKGMAATPQKKSVTTFDRCGTFGCTLPDRHPGLHAFSVDDTRPRRQVKG